jgi:hypothetical protein
MFTDDERGAAFPELSEEHSELLARFGEEREYAAHDHLARAVA